LRPSRNQPDRDEFGEAEGRNKGIAPYVLPTRFMLSTKVKLIINLKTAKALA